MKRRKPDRKARPANEVTEQEVDEFLAAIRNFEGYPRLRDLGRLLPSMNTYKITVILRFLERSKAIIVDNDGYITWVRKDKPDDLTLGDVADMSKELREFLAKDDEN
ncbi:hypothetical protein [Nitrososphaera sp.]|uniref:hypothetical protein n=1 Tax=Nitrososphaera sp. TaxID=1971748 RepID=UPI0018594632|nr:hypothetical protein [Nitrososphaera sp.]NWG37286.1 hypothetical protein [Nitrososphaera sp.]